MLTLLLFALSVSAADPVVNVLDPATLQELESHGYSLGDFVGAPGTSKTSDLYKKSGDWRAVADTVGKPLPHDKNDQLPETIPDGSGDIPDLVRRLRGFADKGARSDKDLKGEFVITHVSNNSAYPYLVERDGDEPRHFDPRWLNSQFAYMKLVAVVNRLDRADITRDSCGDVRFIYRLSYKSKTSSSSLPFFVNLVQNYPKKESCAQFAKPWLASFTPAALQGLRFKQLEVNFQSLRFTSGYMHDLGGQAMYIQRIFRKIGDRFQPVELENTPDVLAIEKDPTLLKRFVEYLKQPENLADLDKGILNISFDPKFLAKISMSWSTLGRARLANRPYAELFRDRRAMIDAIDISKLTYIKSHDALIERLDNLTCMGCHQAGGTAGFHMLGLADPEFSHPFNRQEVALSPHATAEVSRIAAYTSDLASGGRPNAFRPHSTFPAAKWTASGIPKFENLNVGALCVKNPSAFANTPTCGDRTRSVDCIQTVKSPGSLLGECVAKTPSAGDVCWMGDLKEARDKHGSTFNEFAFTDKWKLTGPTISVRGEYTCVLPQSGAPLGRMSRRCTLQEENFAIDLAKTPTEICANQGGQGFDMCAASGDSGACLETKVARAMLDTCTTSRTCREDYICQKLPDYQKISKKDYVRKKNGVLINASTPEKIDGAKIKIARDRGIGFCVPTYFLFNMRLDGHPSPVTGLPPAAPTYNAKLPLRGSTK